MDATVIQSVRKEEAELLRKLAAVQAMLAAYGEQPASAPNQAFAARAPATSVMQPSARPQGEPSSPKDKRTIENFTPYGREAIATSMSFLTGHAAPVKTRELVDALDRIGFEIRGENKINALGALLGRSEDIISHGKMGWTLADPEKAQEIVGKYAHKENEPPSVPAGGSDAAGEGAPPPNPAQDQSNWGSDA